HGIPADELTGRSALLLVDLGTLVARCGPVAGVAHRHAPAAPAAQHETLQEGVTGAHRTPAVAPAPGAIIIEALLIAEELLPAEVARMGVALDDRPIGQGHAAGPTLDARRFVRQRARTRLGTAVDIGAGVARVVQDRQDAAMSQRLPQEFAVAGFPPKAIRE